MGEEEEGEEGGEEMRGGGTFSCWFRVVTEGQRRLWGGNETIECITGAGNTSREVYIIIGCPRNCSVPTISHKTDRRRDMVI